MGKRKRPKGIAANRENRGKKNFFNEIQNTRQTEHVQLSMCCSRTDGNSSVMQKSSTTTSLCVQKAGKRMARGWGRATGREKKDLDYDYIREYCEKLSGHIEIVWVLCERAVSRRRRRVLFFPFRFLFHSALVSQVFFFISPLLVHVAFIFAIRLVLFLCVSLFVQLRITF